MAVVFGRIFVEHCFRRNGILHQSSKHGITNDKYSMANSQFADRSEPLWDLRIENWQLKNGHWLFRCAGGVISPSARACACRSRGYAFAQGEHHPHTARAACLLAFIK